MFHWILTCKIDAVSGDMLFNLYAVGNFGRVKIATYTVPKGESMETLTGDVSTAIPTDFSTWVGALNLTV